MADDFADAVNGIAAIKDPQAQIAFMHSMCNDAASGHLVEQSAVEAIRYGLAPSAHRILHKLAYYLLQAVPLSFSIDEILKFMRQDMMSDDPDLTISALRTFLSCISLQKLLDPRVEGPISEMCKAACTSRYDEVREVAAQLVAHLILQFETSVECSRAFCRELVSLLVDKCLDCADIVSHSAFYGVYNILYRIKSVVHSRSFEALTFSLEKAMFRDRFMLQNRVLALNKVSPSYAIYPLAMVVKDFNGNLEEFCSTFLEVFANSTDPQVLLNVLRAAVYIATPRSIRLGCAVAAAGLAQPALVFCTDQMFEALLRLLNAWIASFRSQHSYADQHLVLMHLPEIVDCVPINMYPPIFSLHVRKVLSECLRGISRAIFDGASTRIESFGIDRVLAVVKTQASSQPSFLLTLLAEVADLVPTIKSLRQVHAAHYSAFLEISSFVRDGCSYMLRMIKSPDLRKREDISEAFAVLYDQSFQLLPSLSEADRAAQQDLLARGISSFLDDIGAWGISIIKLLCAYLIAPEDAEVVFRELERRAKALIQGASFTESYLRAFGHSIVIFRSRFPSLKSSELDELAKKIMAKVVLSVAFRTEVEGIFSQRDRTVLGVLFTPASSDTLHHFPSLANDSTVSADTSDLVSTKYSRATDVRTISGSSDMVFIEAFHRVDTVSRIVQIVLHIRNISFLVLNELVISCTCNHPQVQFLSSASSLAVDAIGLPFRKEELKARETLQVVLPFLLYGDVESAVEFYPRLSFVYKSLDNEKTLPKDEFPVPKLTIRCNPVVVSMFDTITPERTALSAPKFEECWRDAKYRQSIDLFVAGIDDAEVFLMDLLSNSSLSLVTRDANKEAGVLRAYLVGRTWGRKPFYLSMSAHTVASPTLPKSPAGAESMLFSPGPSPSGSSDASAVMLSFAWKSDLPSFQSALNDGLRTWLRSFTQTLTGRSRIRLFFDWRAVDQLFQSSFVSVDANRFHELLYSS